MWGHSHSGSGHLWPPLGGPNGKCLLLVDIAIEIDVLFLWSGPLYRWFPLLPRHILWSRCWVGLHHSHCENRKTGGTELSPRIHSPALYFGTTSLFSRNRATVHEEASSYTQSSSKVILLQPVKMQQTHTCFWQPNIKCRIIVCICRNLYKLISI